MQLIVNGERGDYPEGLTIQGLLTRLGIAQRPVAVEVNKKVVPKAEHTSRELTENDTLEIVTFVGGG
ncbi:MAG TPA: sulfur carrier protein ThiS [Candidatus Hypogeohydataceae bacterium YC41]